MNYHPTEINTEVYMQRFLAGITLVLAMVMSGAPAAAAVELKGVKFADTYQLGNQALLLNGAGIRVKVIIDVYAASLYLPTKDHSAESALSQQGPKSVQAVMLRDVTAEDFVAAMIKGFKANNTDAIVSRYLPKLQELGALMSSVGMAHKGTVVRIDYVPDTGTRITVDGQRQGTDIPGEEFYQALLRIWLGPKPVDSSLKAALLGLN